MTISQASSPGAAKWGAEGPKPPTYSTSMPQESRGTRFRSRRGSLLSMNSFFTLLVPRLGRAISSPASLGRTFSPWGALARERKIWSLSVGCRSGPRAARQVKRQPSSGSSVAPSGSSSTAGKGGRASAEAVRSSSS